MYALSTKAPAIVDAMLSKLTARHNNEVYREVLRQYASGYVTALQQAIAGATITGTILGGAAPPSGPLVSGMLTCTPGSLVVADVDLESSIVFGPITMRDGDRTLRGHLDTQHMRAIRSHVAQHAARVWKTMTSTWFASALPVAQGGIAAWVASTPPVPGPWTAGTTQPFVLAPLAGLGGVVPDPSINVFDSFVTTAARVVPWVFTMPEGNDLTLMLVNDEGETSEMEMHAFAHGWQWLLLDFFHNVQAYDPTGCGASGVAAPGGVITTGTVTLQLLVS